MGVDVVHLKRKVRNPATELLEWRPCECAVTGAGQLVLELTDNDDDDDEVDDNKGDVGAAADDDDRPPPPSQADAGPRLDVPRRLVLDLAWQLESIVQKKKCRTRCELTYVELGTTTTTSPQRRERRVEELMAPSPRHCQQWIALVEDAMRRARRRQSIREGAALASGLDHSSSNGSNRSGKAPSVTRGPSAVAPVSGSHASEPGTMGQSTASSSSGLGVDSDLSSSSSSHGLHLTRDWRGAIARPSTAKPDEDEDQAQDQQTHDAAATAAVAEPHRMPPPPQSQALSRSTTTRPTSASTRALAASQASSSSSMPSTRPRSPVMPLTREGFDARLAVETLRSHRPHNAYDDDDDGDEEHNDSALRDRAAATAATAARGGLTGAPATTTTGARPIVGTRSSRLFSPTSSISTKSSLPPPSRGRRPLPQSQRSAAHVAALLPTATSGTSAATAVAASIQRLRRRERQLEASASASVAGPMGGEELDILVRVESALRQLERENAQTRERELQLTHELQTLQDALRVRTAEKKHLEHELQALARDKEQWRQATERAEGALLQLQEELAIAHEEGQLLSSEKHRLKHQNKELLTQVHRLDSLVYGRF